MEHRPRPAVPFRTMIHSWAAFVYVCRCFVFRKGLAADEAVSWCKKCSFFFFFFLFNFSSMVPQAFEAWRFGSKEPCLKRESIPRTYVGNVFVLRISAALRWNKQPLLAIFEQILPAAANTSIFPNTGDITCDKTTQWMDKRQIGCFFFFG